MAEDEDAAAAESPDSRDDGRPSEPKKPSPLRNPVVRIALMAVGLALLVAFGLWFFHYWTRGRFLQSTDDAYLQSDQVSVATRVSGFVDRVFVSDNQPVKAGALLVKLDEREPRARLEQAEAQVAQGLASIAEAEAQIARQQAQISADEAQLAGAKVQAGFADRQTARYAPLAVSGAESDERYDQMRQTSAQNRAQVVQQAAEVVAARRQMATLTAQVLAGRAQVRQAQAQVRQARFDLDATDLRASIDGRVGDKTVRVGQYAPAGTRMMSVVPLQHLYVTANFKETQVSLMRVGQPVTIKADALPGTVLQGAVESFSPATGAQFALIPPNNATGNFTKIVQRLGVRVRVDAGAEARRILTPGMSVAVSVDTLSAKDDAERIKAENRRMRDRLRAGDAHEQAQIQRGQRTGPGL